MNQPPQVAPPPRVAGGQLPPGTDPSLADWTPRPPRGKAEAWELMGDKDWADPRFRSMNTGPFLNCTAEYPLSRLRDKVFKATAVRLGEAGGFLFDRNTLRVTATWTGGFLTHSDRRFGLLNTPTPKGDIVATTPPFPGWAGPKGQWTAPGRGTSPLPKEWAKYRGLYVNGDRVVLSYTVGETDVLETSSVRTAGSVQHIVRTLRVGAGPKLVMGLTKVGGPSRMVKDEVHAYTDETDPANPRTIARIGKVGTLDIDNSGTVALTIPRREVATTVTIVYTRGRVDVKTLPAAVGELWTPDETVALTQPGAKLWGEPLTTKLVRGTDDGPFAVDTLTIPYQNPFGALFFCTGLDFLPDGRVAICTCHGDVWLAKTDEAAGSVSWQRFATGLYHPLGLKVVDGKVVVLERGQLTRLHDRNGDGEADYYECLANDWDTGAGEHSYDTCLETDPDGNFYFFKTGDTDLPTGGCLMKVSKDGAKAEVFATGFRHPIGMGMSPTGILTGADQEGNWVPSTRIDEYKRGGFYGDMRGHHRAVPPTIYDPPICWLPRDIDNSAGGQAWVPLGAFGPLAGLPLHFSYGRCKPMLLLRQELSDGGVQGGVVGLGVQFLSGVCRGRFHPTDGMLYVCGLNGWQTAAKADGCLQRMRATGKELDVPIKLAVEGDAVRLTFSRDMDAKACAAASSYKAAWWNYRWEAAYGSKRWKPSDPRSEGQDDVPVKSAKVLGDGKTVELRFDKLAPVMQMQVGYNVAAADGKKVVGSVYLTIHSTGK